jgi:excisionase family DNA binding protein
VNTRAARGDRAVTDQVFTTQEVADLVGVTKRCILNWLRDGKIPEPDRDRNRYRVWTQRDLSVVLAYKGLRYQPERWGQHAKDRDPEP